MKPLNLEDFAPLLAAAKAGSNESLGRLLDGLVPLLRSKAEELSAEYLDPCQTPSDFCQDACFEAFRDFRHFDGDSVAEFVVWLLTILRHDMQDWIRARRCADKYHLARALPLDEAAGVPAKCLTPEEEAARNEERAAFARARKSLPWHMRLAIRLHYVEKKNLLRDRGGHVHVGRRGLSDVHARHGPDQGSC